MKYEKSAKNLTLETQCCDSDVEKNITTIWHTDLVKFKCLF